MTVQYVTVIQRSFNGLKSTTFTMNILILDHLSLLFFHSRSEVENCEQNNVMKAPVPTHQKCDILHVPLSRDVHVVKDWLSANFTS